MSVLKQNVEEFEFPIVETESSLLKKFKYIFLNNKEVLLIDLGENVPVYKWFINPKSSIEHYQVQYVTKKILIEIASAHKQFNADLVLRMLQDASQRLRNISKGSVITTEGYELYINEALAEKDTLELHPNSYIRFLENPYYCWKKDELDNRKEIKRNLINGEINASKRNLNSELIEETLADYDLGKGRLTKPVLSEITGLSISTIKNHLNDSELLKEMFSAIKKNSGTKKQIQNKKYNNRKRKLLKSN